MKLLVLSLLILPLAACSSSNATPCTSANAGSPITAVGISDYKFSPECFAVQKGKMVTFTNNGPSAHTVTHLDGPENFDSGQIVPNQLYQWTVGSIAGTQTLHCTNHPGMNATAIIE